MLGSYEAGKEGQQGVMEDGERRLEVMERERKERD